MDHDEAIRKFEHLMLREADQAYEAATELETLVSHLPNEKSRQLAQFQAKASHTGEGVSRTGAEGKREIRPARSVGSMPITQRPTACAF